jgi:hypothetical protein
MSQEGKAAANIIKESSKPKDSIAQKSVKYIVGGVGAFAAFVGGYLLGKNKKNKTNNNRGRY